ncbi:hypothetical protein DFP72DRAFT_263915 [Ephemerocybe angulata]|uniref:Uncharacterized protein n=1 Tax=Ephemerocybe angulata TaxID=980116 RepID=A0A8H6M5W8_9AGAR|nr:hypothetical protein DFP72DRAFT_263915 [Tulosesus angulatus]
MVGGPTTCCSWNLIDVLNAGMDKISHNYYTGTPAHLHSQVYDVGLGGGRRLEGGHPRLHVYLPPHTGIRHPVQPLRSTDCQNLIQVWMVHRIALLRGVIPIRGHLPRGDLVFDLNLDNSDTDQAATVAGYALYSATDRTREKLVFINFDEDSAQSFLIPAHVTDRIEFRYTFAEGDEGY